MQLTDPRGHAGGLSRPAQDLSALDPAAAGSVISFIWRFSTNLEQALFELLDAEFITSDFKIYFSSVCSKMVSMLLINPWLLFWSLWCRSPGSPGGAPALSHAQR
jgi:hypothetical protein